MTPDDQVINIVEMFREKQLRARVTLGFNALAIPTVWWMVWPPLNWAVVALAVIWTIFVIVLSGRVLLRLRELKLQLANPYWELPAVRANIQQRMDEVRARRASFHVVSRKL